jgi:hypothetical protein
MLFSWTVSVASSAGPAEPLRIRSIIRPVTAGPISECPCATARTPLSRDVPSISLST